MATVFVDPAPPVTTGNPEWDKIVGPADASVRDVLGEDAAGKDINWEVVPGRFGRPPTFRLTMTADGESAAVDIDAATMTDPQEVRWKGIDVWGALNDKKIDREVRAIHEILGDIRRELEHGE